MAASDSKSSATDVEKASAKVTIDEFCASLSGRDRRPELIYAFSVSETSAGVVKDDVSKFEARYAAFSSKPV